MQQPDERLDHVEVPVLVRTAASSRSHCSGKRRATPPRKIQSNSSCRPVVTPASTASVTRSGCASAYASASVLPQDAPQTSQPSMPRCSRSNSMSATRFAVVLCVRSIVALAGVRRAPPAVALVELHDAVCRRVEEAARPRRAARARPAVQHHRRLPVRVAGGLPVDGVPVADVEHALCVRLYRGIAAHSPDNVVCGFDRRPDTRSRRGRDRPQLGALARRGAPEADRDGRHADGRPLRRARRPRPERAAPRALPHSRDRRGGARGDRRLCRPAAASSARSSRTRRRSGSTAWPTTPAPSASRRAIRR